MIDTTPMTQLEIWQSGLDVLGRELGTAGMIRFLQIFEKGSGDYTAEREQWLPTGDIDTISKLIKESQS